MLPSAVLCLLVLSEEGERKTSGFHTQNGWLVESEGNLLRGVLGSKNVKAFQVTP
jgi:hypothetical protein